MIVIGSDHTGIELKRKVISHLNSKEIIVKDVTDFKDQTGDDYPDIAYIVCKNVLKEKDIENVRVIKTGCFGLCAKGPIVIIRPEDTFYANVTPNDCEEIIQTHIIEGKNVMFRSKTQNRKCIKYCR